MQLQLTVCTCKQFMLWYVWYNEECEAGIKDRKQPLKKVKSPTADNNHIIQAKARHSVA